MTCTSSYSEREKKKGPIDNLLQVQVPSRRGCHKHHQQANLQPSLQIYLPVAPRFLPASRLQDHFIPQAVLLSVHDQRVELPSARGSVISLGGDIQIQDLVPPPPPPPPPPTHPLFPMADHLGSSLIH